MMEVSYQEALVEHGWKKIEKEQGCCDKEALEVRQLNEDLAGRTEPLMYYCSSTLYEKEMIIKD